MQKTIIALWGVHDSGKTATISIAYNDLKKRGRCIDSGVASNVEVKGAILEIDGVKVGFFSQGDFGPIVKQLLEPLITSGCTVIVCATRSRGGTVEAVKGHKAEFEIVWIEKDRQQTNHEIGNRQKADEVISAVETAVVNARLVEA